MSIWYNVLALLVQRCLLVGNIKVLCVDMLTGFFTEPPMLEDSVAPPGGGKGRGGGGRGGSAGRRGARGKQKVGLRSRALIEP